MPVRISTLQAVITADMSNFERGMEQAEKRSSTAAKNIDRNLNSISVSTTNRGTGTVVADLNARFKKDLDKFDKEFEAKFKKVEADINKALDALEKPREVGKDSLFNSEGLLRQLDQLRIGASQLGRGSLGGLPNVIKAYGIAANEGAVATGALSTSALTMGIVAGGAALAVVGAGAAMVKMANDAAASASALERLQDQTGLSADRLQYLQAAASLTNVEITSITSAFEHYKQAAHEANSGNKEMAAVFAALGQTTQNVSELTFEQFIGKLKDITNESTRTETAQKVLSSSARDLQRFYVELNAEGGRLKEVLRQNAQLMDGEARAAAKSYNQEVALLTLQWDKFYYSIANKVIPIIRQLIKEMNEGTKPPEGMTFFKEGYRPLTPSETKREAYGPYLSKPFAGVTGFADPAKFANKGDK